MFFSKSFVTRETVAIHTCSCEHTRWNQVVIVFGQRFRICICYGAIDSRNYKTFNIISVSIATKVGKKNTVVVLFDCVLKTGRSSLQDLVDIFSANLSYAVFHSSMSSGIHCSQAILSCKNKNRPFHQHDLNSVYQRVLSLPGDTDSLQQPAE
jgi:hypothetical protein